MAKLTKHVYGAGLIGNGIEVYDTAIYVFLAPYIAMNFFNHLDKVTGLIYTFGVFFAGFIARPLGSIIFGHIGDVYGRKLALLSSVVLMALGGTAIGLLPTYATAGTMAVVGLVILRLLQGLSLGGEYTGSAIFMVEHADVDKRGFAGSCAMAAGNAGALVAAVICFLITKILPPSQVLQWGWRIPFLLSIVGGGFGLYFRARVDETHIFTKTKQTIQRNTLPIVESFRHYKYELILTLGMVGAGLVATYLIFAYISTYMSSVLHYSPLVSLPIVIASIIFIVLIMPFAGRLSDKIGRKPVLFFGAIGMCVWAVPYLYLIGLESAWVALFSQLMFAIPAACYFAVSPVVIAEIMPVHIRFSAASLAYNVGAILFGGATPMLSMYLIKHTGNQLMPGYYMATVAVIAVVSICLIAETREQIQLTD